MPARKEQRMACRRADAADDPIRTFAHLLRRFPAGAAVAEKFPIGPLRTKLSPTASFVLSIVPFDQVFINVSDWFEAGQFTGPGRTLQRTGQHLGKCQSLESFTKSSCGALATLGSRKLG